ncbi:thiol-disulfide isomerase/thioredoxin [Paenibacillus sp. V4I3]|uniref:thioredoxin family protein n=1 Tax=unclassified Paenibacillus TaxID=185978 RepID=UPI0027870C4C|nr:MULTISPECIES: thioredoxin family protein [unclassified Paenibacillus]MDQ0875409.1 thiol-disulfide isomerase/thioredoxin [Paenibacillus sp. V4I3]MDQ0888509.1 thiol-disulfide isomerase/thioredoxin [Paenibacillus sp. V4I9]
MQELTGQELLERLSRTQEGSFAVFLYTPFCGTCKVTERMLDIIMTMLPFLPLVKSNINFLPQITREWQISSVPCIVIIEQGKEKEFIYRMQSVDELYRKLLPLNRM